MEIDNTCGSLLLSARLKNADRDASQGEELERAVDQLREAWPEIRILLI